VRLYAIPAVHRFPRGQAVGSSGRLGTGVRASAGKRYGTSGAKRGKAPRPWACSAAAVLCLSDPPAAPQDRARLEKKPAQGQAWPLLAQQLARALSDRRNRQGACERETFCQRSTIREGSGGASGLTGHPGEAPQRGARHGGMPGVRARPGASRSPCPEPSAWMGPPLSRLFSTARVAHGLRGRLLTRAWFSLDNVDALRPLLA
jgi:hypothetical protein